MVDGGRTLILAHRNVLRPEISDKLLEDDYILEVTWDGEILWDYDTNHIFATVSGGQAHGGSIESDGPLVVAGYVFVNSGYLFGDRMAGNVLLAFAAD